MANKRNETAGKFSPAQSFHSVLGQHLVDKPALIEFFQNPVIDQLFRFDFFNLWITSLHQSNDIRNTRRGSIGFLVRPRNQISIAFFSVLFSDSKILLQNF